MALQHKIYLASKSPRRREIIENAGFSYELIHVDVEEVFPAEMPTSEVAEFLAIKKAKAIDTLPIDGVVLAADTIVILDGNILGKPTDKEDAARMLRRLSNRIHTVITGVCLMNREKTVSFSDESKVHFAALSEEEIQAYIDSPAPHDKAGAYGIQDGLGMVKVSKIIGSYFNIMGLPIHRVYEEISKFSS